MDDAPTPTHAPIGWLEALAQSEAELAAGMTVSGDVVHQRIRDSAVRLETRKVATLGLWRPRSVERMHVVGDSSG